MEVDQRDPLETDGALERGPEGLVAKCAVSQMDREQQLVMDREHIACVVGQRRAPLQLGHAAGAEGVLEGSALRDGERRHVLGTQP